MVTTRVLAGLVLATVVAAGPAAAQLWPNGGGPSGDVLRNSIEQYQRLAPPPVDAERVASLPDMPPVTSRVDVGTPVLALPDQPAPRVRTVTATTRQAARRTSVRRASVRRGPRGSDLRGTDDSRLERDLAARERRLQELQRQIDSDRARLEQRRGGISSLNPIPPAGATTLPPSAPPPTATLR